MTIEQPNTLESLKAQVGEFLLLGDDGVIDVVIAAVIANKLDLDPVWLMLVAGSSSGKSELLTPLFDLSFVIPISDLTVNTFASGYKLGGGKQAGLLAKYQNGIMVFKDFTSILSKGREARDIILGQMREIFDGKFDKHTGTGDVIAWKGKMGVVAASTAAVYAGLADSTSMGQRFVYYNIKQPKRFEAARRSQENASKGTEMRAQLSDTYKRYITSIIERIDQGGITYDPPAELVTEMLRIADFACRARSPVHVDFKSGNVDMLPDLEMPGRVTKQLLAMAGAFMAMNQCEDKGMAGGETKEAISHHQRRVIYRCAFDSIPDMRRATMKLLARYKGGVNTVAMATELGLPSDSVKKYLYQLNVLGICSRRAESGNKGHHWTMDSDEHRRVVCLLEGIEALDQSLVRSGDDNGEPISLDPESEAINRAALESFDAAPSEPSSF